MRFENTITIERSLGDVFAYLADFEKVPTWNYAIARTRKLSEGPVGIGTRYRQVRKLPRPSEESFQVTGVRA
jgi:polyketide cyclase/dehydrase/lipid transport protein